jgi:Tol biopolymer transport system component
MPALFVVALAAASDAQQTTRVSVSSAGAQVTGNSEAPALCAEGRFVAFYSQAAGLVPEDANTIDDVFVRDRLLGTTTRVSVTTAGVAGNGDSDFPDLSADGRHVAFRSSATNLDPAEANNSQDVFVHDRLLGTTTLASRFSNGTGATFGISSYPSISADGRYVAFESTAAFDVADNNAKTDIYLHDLALGLTERVSVNNAAYPANVLTGSSYAASVSGDGRFVAFASDAANAVSGDTNTKRDVFVRDRLLGGTSRVSVATGGTQATDSSDSPAISPDGTWIAFDSLANNLVAGDTNGQRDVFLHNRLTGETTRVSVDSAGVQANFPSSQAAVSDDGRFVTFKSDASNLVPGDTNGGSDVFRHDRSNGQTVRVSVQTGGAQADESSSEPAISADGSLVAFDSTSPDMVPGDTNDRRDVFVHDPAGCTAGGAWVGYGAGLAGTGGWVPALSGTGCPLPGAAITLHVDDALGGATGALFVGLASSAAPFKGGTFHVGALVLQVVVPVGGAVGVAGAGELDLPAALPADPALSGASLLLQGAFADAGAVQGVSLTQGLELEIG